MALAALLRSFTWPEWRAHPWRPLAAALAVMLGVALAFSVHLINASALSEFAQAVRSVGGQPDLALRSAQGPLDESLYPRLAQAPEVAWASPVLELATQAAAKAGPPVPLQVLGVDALRVAAIAPELLPRASEADARLALFAPATVFLNAAARQRLPGPQLHLQSGSRLLTVQVAGSVAAGGPPLAVMDLGAAQDLFGRGGELSRIDLRLQPGADAQALAQRLALPTGLRLSAPDEAAGRAGQLSRAYRVNLTVLALVALFTGAFLVFSVLALSVAKRAPALALLGVLGLTGRERLGLVLAESLMLGLVGSGLGLALGTALAALALQWLGGDLGGGYFSGVSPRLQWSAAAALAYGALGVLAALAGGAWPARAAQQLPLAQTLKGLGGPRGRSRAVAGLALMAVGGLLTLAPPILGLSLAAYVAVALILWGGIVALPGLMLGLHPLLKTLARRHPLWLLAIERAARVRESASVAVSGVVAALSLAVAITVMVASFRGSVMQWLDVVLPADLYVRSAASTAAADTQYIEPEALERVRALPGVARLQALRVRPLTLDPARPALTLVARDLSDVGRELPLVGAARPVPPGQVGVYVSEAVASLYGVQPGQAWAGLSAALARPGEPPPPLFVAGVWRDYARQFGTVVMDRREHQRITGDERVNDLALWLNGAQPAAQVQAALREALAAPWLDLASASDIRATSLRIFDRSFAVTHWLQAVAIVIGLFGIAANFSAQVLARRKEFGLLAHLGLTRRQVLAVVAGEGAAFTFIGSLAGLALGLAVAAVLVHVVNPQSFHWTMELQVPAGRLALLALAVVVAGTFTAWLAGRAAAAHDAVLAVKEDW